MKKKITKKQQEAEELSKKRLLWGVMVIGIILFIGILVQNIKADQIVHKFKSPSFSGVNTSSHYLTIENQEFNRRKQIKDEIKAAVEEVSKKNLGKYL